MRAVLKQIGFIIMLFGMILHPVFAQNYEIPQLANHQKQKNEMVRINQESGTLNLEIGKSIIAELPGEAEDVIISNPEIISTIIRTGKQILFIGKAVGETNILFFIKGQAKPISLEVKVDQDLQGLRTAIKRVVPKSNIDVQIMRGDIVLTGIAPNNESAGIIARLSKSWTKKGSIVNLITVKGKDQVQLKVRVVEMQRSLSKRLGLDIASTFGMDHIVKGTAGATNAFSVTGASSDTAGSVITSAFEMTGKLFGAEYSLLPNLNFQALERVGVIRTLSEPTLVTVSGENAEFLAGGEIPVPTGYDRESNQVIISYKEFGVGLGFTPIVLNDNRISLNVSVQVSEIGSESLAIGGGGSNADGTIQSSFTMPSFNTRRVSTTVEMPSGRSFVIAGLIKEETRKAIEAIPGLRKVKILGELFKSRDFKNNQTELVVIVTPYLVNPVHPNDVAVPGTDFIARPQKISELSRLQEIYMTPGSDLEGQSFSGPYGFVIE